MRDDSEEDQMLNDPEAMALINKFNYLPIACVHLSNSLYRGTPGIPESVQARCHKCKRFIYS